MHLQMFSVEKPVDGNANITGSLWMASLTTWYCIANMVYPPECANVLLFIEKTLPKLPLSGKPCKQSAPLCVCVCACVYMACVCTSM